jgi:NADH:ubiquinone oxidoreductase subunit 4 (subunit M)
VEAPTVGSVILASLLLKLGYYGFLRLCLPYFKEAIFFYKPALSVLCVIGCIYGSLLSLSQSDIKKIIAYSSVSHMSLCSLGLFSCNFFGVIGSLVMAIGHSFVSSGLFYLVGVVYDRYHSRSLDYFSGFNAFMPILSFFFFFFFISNFGFPISINFVAEFLIFLGAFK